MNEKIVVKMGTKDDFIKLSKLDFTNSYDSVFVVRQSGFKIDISEKKLPTARTNAGDNYSMEIIESVIPNLNKKNYIHLVGFYENEPAGYLVGKIENWPKGKVITVDGVLVATEYHKKGIAKKMILELISIAQKTKNCRGISVEMDTEKYQANKLLLTMGFNFAGTKFYIYSNDNPSDYSKEALYFYYPIIEK